MNSKRTTIIILIFVAAVIFSSCTVGQNGSSEDATEPLDTEYSTEKATESTQAKDYQEIKELEIKVLNNQNNEFVFSFSIDDFIDSFNGYYYKDHCETFLKSANEWASFKYDETPHSSFPALYYRFQQNVENYNEPTISVYVPENSEYVQEITLDFPEHSYTEMGYKLYKENCCYTFKVFFPEFNNEQIQKLYAAIRNEAYASNLYFSNTEMPFPKVLYYKDNIGIYPYFRLGMMFIAVIPVTQQYFDKMASDNIKIYQIDDLV